MTFRDNETSVRDELNGLVPRLRRYARALTRGSAASSELADDLVHATLMRALGARHIGMPCDLAIRVYATLTQLNRDLAVSGRQARVAGTGRPVLVASGRSTLAERQTRLSAGLLALPLEAREALLLVSIEGFDYAQAARILRISRGALIARLTQARTALDAALETTPRTIPRTATNPMTKSLPRPVSGDRSKPLPSPAASSAARGHLRLVSSRS